MTLLHLLGLPKAKRVAYLSGIKKSPPDRIIRSAMRYTGISHETMKSATRKQAIAFCRHAVIYALRNYTDLTLKEIGSLMRRDYTTVINSVKAAEALVKNDRDFEKMYNGIIEKI